MLFFLLLGYCFSGGCHSILQLIICCEKRKECHRRCFCCVLFLFSMFVRFLFVFDLLLILFRIVLWPSVGKRQIYTVLILDAVLVVLVPLPFGVWGGMWNSIVSAPDHCLFVSFSQSTQAQGRRRLWKSGPAIGRRKLSLSAEGTTRGEHEIGVFHSRKGGGGLGGSPPTNF